VTVTCDGTALLETIREVLFVGLMVQASILFQGDHDRKNEHGFQLLTVSKNVH
jgi:hypothetical protein